MVSVPAPSRTVKAGLGPAIPKDDVDARHKAGHDGIFDGGRYTNSTRLSQAGGIKVAGADLARPLSPELKDAIWRAFLAHHIVVFADQFLSREQQFAFAAHFGEVEVHGAHRGEAKRYDVAHVMTNLDADGNPVVRSSKAANYHWHTDKPYHPAPPMLTMLRAVEVPPEGGDTEFANAGLAYDALPEGVKRRITGLRVVFRPAFDDSRPAVAHPLVRTHPETCRKALYLGNHSTHILGMPETDSRALLAELVAHATQPQFVYRHRWRAGDLVMWDNRCLLHRLVVDPALGKYRRIMHRSVVKGTVPF